MPLGALSGGLGPLGVASGVFSPANIAGLKLWLKADAITGLSDGAAVSSWADSSGSGNSATQATGANQPTYKTGGPNGLPSILFDGLQLYFSLPNSFTSLTAAEVFIVLRAGHDPSSTATSNGLWDFGSAGGQNTHYPFTDGVIYDGFATTARKTVGNPTPSLVAWHLYHVASQSSNWTAWLNETQLFTTASNTVGWTTTPLLGANTRSAPTRYFDGNVAEIILYNSALSTTLRQQVANYLNAKYTIY